MNSTLEERFDVVRKRFSVLKEEMEAGIQDRIKRGLDSAFSLEEKNRNREREIRDELNSLDILLNQVKAYYRGYYENASMSVQIGSYPEKPVNMLEYKNELSNPDRRAAADSVVKTAKANMLYIMNRKKALNSELERLKAKSGNTARTDYADLEERCRRECIEEFRPAVLQQLYDPVLIDCCDLYSEWVNKGKNINWESREFISQNGDDSILFGYAERTLNLPECYWKYTSELPNAAPEGRVYSPLYLSFSEPFRVLVNYHVSNAQRTQEGIRTLLGSMLCAVPPKSLKTYFFDLEKMNASSLESLYHLCGGGEAFIETVPTDEDSALALMNRIRARCDEVAEKMIGYSSLESYNKAHPEDLQPRQLIVIYGCPERMNSRLLDPFMRLYYMSRDVGLSIIVIHSANADISGQDAKVFFQNMMDDATVIRTEYDRQYIQYGEEKAPFRWYTGLNMLSDAFIRSVNEAYAAKEEKEHVTDHGLDGDICHVRGNKGLDLPFGMDENDQVMRWQVTDTQNEMNFSAYVSGSAGSGKSTLLHTLIYAILKTCHPEDVELWLVDFKMTEFRRYAVNRPPHVKYIVLENSEEVVLDLVDRLYETMNRRIRIFDQYRIKDILTMDEKFRKAHLPLIVVMIDEFATMSQILRNTAAVSDLSYPQKLENLLSKGRAYGFRFIFSDQSYEAGISGLTEKSKNQIGFRFGLSNASMTELKSTLNLSSEYMTDQVSHWMASLPAHVALTVQKRKKPGMIEEEKTVHRVRVSYIDECEYENLTERLNEMYHPEQTLKGKGDDCYLDKQYIVVDGKQELSWDDVRDEIRAWDSEKNYAEDIHRYYVGKPCRIQKQKAVELPDGLGENLLLFMSTPALSAEVIQSAVRSAADPAVGHGTKITILASEDDRTYASTRNDWRDCRCFDRIEKICGYVSELYQRIRRKEYSNELIVCFGLYELVNEWNGLPERRAERAVNAGGSNEGTIDFVQPAEVGKKTDDIFTKLMAENIAVQEEETPESDMSFENDFAEIDRLLSRDPGAEEKERVPDNSFGTEEDLYNAWTEFREILQYGPRYGYHFILPFNDYSEFREIKAGNRIYRGVLYNRLVKEELGDLMGFGRYAAIPEGAVRYVSKRESFSLRPYRKSGSEAIEEDDIFA